MKVAGALIAATAVAGVAARSYGTGVRPGVGTPVGKTSFSAPRTGRVSFAGTLDKTAVLRGREGEVRMELVIGGAADEPRRSQRVPTDLVIILDRSGSMAGEKIEHARAAVRQLVAQLGPDDRFALVTYSNEAMVALPLTAVSDRAREAWLTSIAEIPADGGTNIASGIDLGLDVIEHARISARTPRAILISDGLANQGDASHEGLVRRAGRAAHGEYVLSAVGVGADFNEVLMTALADAGTGNYYYLRASQDLTDVFAREFDAARTTVASGLAVRIEPPDGVRVVDAAGYPLEPETGAVVFRPGALFAGQERRIWVTLAVPTHTVADYELGKFSLAYTDGDERKELGLSGIPHVACVEGEDDFFARVDVPSWTRAVLVDGYNKMQEQVAREVKEGRRDEALRKLRTFREETAAANERLQSAPVSQKLMALDTLEADVSAAFEGENQAARQNDLGKVRGAEALDLRRAGSKK